jgi:hypothetical protein
MERRTYSCQRRTMPSPCEQSLHQLELMVAREWQWVGSSMRPCYRVQAGDDVVVEEDGVPSRQTTPAREISRLKAEWRGVVGTVREGSREVVQ